MYSKIYRNVLFPCYETYIRKRGTVRYMKELSKTQWLSHDELCDIQWNKVKKLLYHAYSNVPYYKELFTKNKITPNDITEPRDLRKIPFLTKDDIRLNQDKLLAVNIPGRQILSQVTGGSTGTPLRFKLNSENYGWRLAMVRRVYGWADYDYGKKTVFIWGAPVVRQPFFKKAKHDLDEWLKGRKIYNTFYFNSETMARYLNQINKYKPQYIVAYVTPLYNFARFIKENKKEVEKPIAVIAAAEKLFDTQRKLLEEVFQCPVFETYGCREVTSIAGECKEHNGMHINMETIYLEIVRGYEEAQAGQSGEIVITDLTNYAMPFIRYKNEDIGSLSDRQCQCGRGLSLLEKVEGRVLDTIKTEDGRLIPGEFFIYWFMRFDGIERFQIVQEDLYHLHIKIVQNKKFPLERLEYLKKVICDIMGNKINIHFDLVEEIPLTQSGKFRVVISKVPIDFEMRI